VRFNVPRRSASASPVGSDGSVRKSPPGEEQDAAGQREQNQRGYGYAARQSRRIKIEERDEAERQRGEREP
jgi:hypothetical protein